MMEKREKFFDNSRVDMAMGQGKDIFYLLCPYTLLSYTYPLP